MQMSLYTLKPYAYYRARIQGSSNRLVSAAWRQYRAYLSVIDEPRDDSDVLDVLDSIISEKVNNPKSVFYLRG